ncbi:MAG: oligosaccharide flippase family protein [Gaiellaceae bacterium]
MTSENTSDSIMVGEEVVAAVPSEMSGLHAGAIVLAGIGVANLGNYVFHLLSARSLGPASYGDVATLAALTGIIGLPLGGAQVFIARHVAAETTRRQSLNSDGYVSAFGGAMLIAGLALTVVLLVLSPLIQHVLSIQSLSAVVFTALFTAPSFVAPALIGAAQGRQQFFLVTLTLGAPSALRVVLVALALAAGFGAAGAMAATFVAAVVAVAIPALALRRYLVPLASWRPRISRSDIVGLAPVAGGLLAITALSTDDLLVAKAVFSNHQAGLYGSASLIGRVILYLPAAIVTVLLPKVSARVAAQRDTNDIFAQSLAVTAAFCIGATVVYAAAPHLIVKIAFGSQYEGSAGLLWMFGVAMTFYALLNVLLTYQLGLGASRTSWLLLGAAAVQAVAFAVFHDTPRELLATSIVVGAAVLVIHELFVAPTLVRALWRSRST